MQDFIGCVDDIEYRKVLDYSINTYGHFLIDFLISSNMCMLNGRHNSLDISCWIICCRLLSGYA